MGSQISLKQLIKVELNKQIIEDGYTYDINTENEFYLNFAEIPQLIEQIYLIVQMNLDLNENNPCSMEELDNLIIGVVSCELTKV